MARTSKQTLVKLRFSVVQFLEETKSNLTKYPCYGSIFWRQENERQYFTHAVAFSAAYLRARFRAGKERCQRQPLLKAAAEEWVDRKAVENCIPGEEKPAQMLLVQKTTMEAGYDDKSYWVPFGAFPIH
jgi:hypothetical protein